MRESQDRDRRRDLCRLLGILALVSQLIAAGTVSVATLDRKGAVTCNRRRSRLCIWVVGH
jgi:hypothetical protein